MFTLEVSISETFQLLEFWEPEAALRPPEAATDGLGPQSRITAGDTAVPLPRTGEDFLVPLELLDIDGHTIVLAGNQELGAQV